MSALDELTPKELKKLESTFLGCQLCGKTLTKTQKKFCSLRCFGLVNAHKEKNPRWKGGKPSCVDCGKELSRRDAIRCTPCRGKTNESRDRMSKLSKSRFGDSSPTWKGGITPIYKKLRASKEYKEWQKLILKRDKYTCQVCRKKGGNLHVDHIFSWSKYPDLRLSVENGRTLCVKCHYKITFGKEMPEKSKWGIRK